jgi:hypothetical protein
MSAVKYYYGSLSPKIHRSVILSDVIFICKIIVLIGLLVTFFSDHWATNSIVPYVYTGKYKFVSLYIFDCFRL